MTIFVELRIAADGCDLLCGYEFKGGSEMTLPFYVFLRTNVPNFFLCAVSELTAGICDITTMAAAGLLRTHWQLYSQEKGIYIIYNISAICPASFVV